MKILITGGAGFIGSNFVRYLLNKYPDYEIVNLDKLTYSGNLENLKDVENNPNYRFIKGDICDSQIVDEVGKGCDVIINFAAESHVDRSILGPESFIKTDIYGTYTLLEATRKHKMERIIQISTDECYGSIEKGSFKETDPLNPSSPYAASKASADLLCLSYFTTYKLPIIITRSSNNYGPYQYPEKLIPLFITNALENKPLPLYGDGLNVRDWLYVLDNCQAIDLILHKGRIGEIYNVGADNERTNIKITKAILKILEKGEDLIKKVKDRPGHDRRYSLNSSKIRKLGWKPEYNFEKALEETVDWYRNNESWWRKLKVKAEEFFKKQYGN
ncbi:dTDP-glucose 4,6-dehydratase [subsurface metagenome]